MIHLLHGECDSQFHEQCQSRPPQKHTRVKGGLKCPCLCPTAEELSSLGSPNYRTSSLVTLESHCPTTARTPKGEWGRITSTLQPREWERALVRHPDQAFAQYICTGIKQGFHIGFNYQLARCRSAKGNMKSVQEHKEVVEQYIGVECGAKRLLGPFNRDDYPHVQVRSRNRESGA